jgi:regulator of protease activity HflC (stomatin/prohibitin superfamily)
MGRLSPIVTHLFGLVFAVLIGLNEGLAAARMLYERTGSPLAWQAAFWSALVVLVFVVYVGGIQRKMKIGYTGVPTFLGLRIGGILLSEGQHWVFPAIMGIQPVSTKVDVTEQIVDPKDHSKLDEVLSLDDVVMRGRYVIQYQVVDPATWLGVNKPLDALHEIATPVFRQAIARHESTQLVRENLKNEIGEEITRALRRSARHFGMGNLHAQVAVIRYSPKVEEALERIKIEVAEKKAETTNAETAIALVKKVIEQVGMSPQEAGAFIQIERDKTKSERKVFGIENSEKIAKAFIDVLETFLNKGGKP